MIALIQLTVREMLARRVILGLFVVATLVWGALALALQLDVVDGSLAGARLFGEDLAAPTSQPAPAPGSIDSTLAAGDLSPADSAALAEFQQDRAQERAQQEPQLPFGAASSLEALVFGAEAFAAGAAYWVGILLALFAGGGLIASFLERGQVDLLLAKPLSRSHLLAGRLMGVGVVMLTLLTYLLGMVWLVMSIKSGVWNPRFLLAIGVVFLMFAVLYSVVTLVSVAAESAPLALIAVLGLLFVTLILAIPNLETQITRTWRPLLTGLRTILPQFPGVGVGIVPQLAVGTPVDGLWRLGASALFGAACYAGAFALFSRKDF